MGHRHAVGLMQLVNSKPLQVQQGWEARLWLRDCSTMTGDQLEGCNMHEIELRRLEGIRNSDYHAGYKAGLAEMDAPSTR